MPAASATATHHSAAMLSRLLAIFAVFGFMPMARANFDVPPSASITSENELTMGYRYSEYPMPSTPIVPIIWVQSEAMPRTALAPPDLTTQYGRLRWARENAGYSSIRAAASAFGFNENTYKSHEQGIRGSEGLKTKHLERYARAFKVSKAWLATGTGDPLRPDLTTDQLELARKLLKAIGE